MRCVRWSAAAAGSIFRVVLLSVRDAAQSNHSPVLPAAILVSPILPSAPDAVRRYRAQRNPRRSRRSRRYCLNRRATPTGGR
ncbi:hypothetical protein CUJ84_Chr002055 [Rhizobium leguminosarum]|uniref:Uncharacterized protein n=1 Tax=Rhizobium leguminosarum TaxID=384 RepID=A0A2K9Z2S4_RHILE|nr:hypothetical protein CUJ84_Chr002055 [Rhizobium leguminosarum]